MKPFSSLFILSILTLLSQSVYAQGNSELPPDNAKEQETVVEIQATAEAAPENNETVSNQEAEESKQADEDETVRLAAPTVEENEDYLLIDQVDTSLRLNSGAFFADRAISEVDEEKMDRMQASSISDALEESPGVFIQSTNPGAGSVIIRGAVGPENMMVFDGVRYNQSTYRTGPNQYLNLVEPNALSSIRVLRGPSGVLYGGGSIGGAVFLTPRALEDSPLYHAKVGFRSADMGVLLGFESTVGTEDKHYLLQLGADVRMHNDRRIGKNGNDDLIVANLSKDGKVVTSGYQTMNWRARGQVQVSDNIKMRLDYFGGTTADAPRTDRIGGGEIRFYDNYENLLYTTLEYDGEDFLDQVRWNLSFHQSKENVRRFNCKRVEKAIGSEKVKIANDPVKCADFSDPTLYEKRRLNFDVTNTVGTSLSWVSTISPIMLTLQYGFDAYFDFVNSSRKDGKGLDGELKDASRGNFSDKSKYAVAGVYALGDWDALTFGNNVINLRAGVRGEGTWAHASDVTPELGDVNFKNLGVVGSATLSYFYADLAHVYFNWAQGFRPPNLQEATVLGDAGSYYDVPNADLKPERSDTLELGTKLNFPKFFRLNANVFASLLSNRITGDPTEWNGASKTADGKEYRQRINSETGYYYGAELDLETTPIYYTSAFGNVTWYDGALETKKEDSGFKKGFLHSVLGSKDKFYTTPRRLAPLKWTAGVTLATDPSWYVTFWAQGALKQDKLAKGDKSDLRICEMQPGVVFKDAGQTCPGSKAWTTLNLRGGWKNDNVYIDLAINNLLDVRYRPHGSGYGAPGVNAMATIGYKAF